MTPSQAKVLALADCSMARTPYPTPHPATNKAVASITAAPRRQIDCPACGAWYLRPFSSRSAGGWEGFGVRSLALSSPVSSPSSRHGRLISPKPAPFRLSTRCGGARCLADSNLVLLGV